MKAQLKIVGYQAALILVTASAAYGFYPEQPGLKGVLYGGAISIFASIVMACRLNQAVGKLLQGNQRGNLYVYLGAIERLFFAVVFFGVGFLWFKLNPLPMVVGLIAGQIGFVIGGYRVKD